MHEFRVIGVGEVLQLDFPIPRHWLFGRQWRDSNKIGFLIALPVGLQLGKTRRERRRVVVQIDEDEIMPQFEPNGWQRTVWRSRSIAS